MQIEKIPFPIRTEALSHVLTQKKSSIWEIWLSDEITDKPVSTVAILLDIGNFFFGALLQNKNMEEF